MPKISSSTSTSVLSPNAPNQSELAKILTIDRTLWDLEVKSKKKAFERMAACFHDTQPMLDKNTVFDALFARERLGNTAAGEGVAIPHCRFDDIERPLAAFAHLKQRIDYDAPDHIGVNFIFCLIVPTDATQQHLALLAHISAIFRQEGVRQTLLEAHSSEELFQRLICASTNLHP